MENDNKHTPGPWSIDTRYPGYVVVRKADTDNANGWELAKVHAGLKDGEQIPNARLIAAAPELLAALEWTADALNTEAGDLYKAHIEQARAIIKRAKGE